MNKQLGMFIHQQLKKGHALDAIVKELLDEGFDENTVRAALADLHSREYHQPEHFTKFAQTPAGYLILAFFVLVYIASFAFFAIIPFHNDLFFAAIARLALIISVWATLPMVIAATLAKVIMKGLDDKNPHNTFTNQVISQSVLTVLCLLALFGGLALTGGVNLGQLWIVAAVLVLIVGLMIYTHVYRLHLGKSLLVMILVIAIYGIIASLCILMLKFLPMDWLAPSVWGSLL